MRRSLTRNSPEAARKRKGGRVDLCFQTINFSSSNLLRKRNSAIFQADTFRSKSGSYHIVGESGQDKQAVAREGESKRKKKQAKQGEDDREESSIAW